jgi:hypothetical protein
MNAPARVAACGLLLVVAFLPQAGAQDMPAPPQSPANELPLPVAPPLPSILPEAAPIPLPVPEGDSPRSPDAFDGFDGFGGGGRFGAMAGLNGASPAVLALTDRSVWYPGQHVSGQSSDLGFVKESIGFTVPLYRDGPNSIAFNSNVGALIFQTHALLPDTGQPFPDTIWNIRFGMNYSHLFANEWFAMLGVSVGSASDRPFEAWRDVNFGLFGSLRIPQGERNAWLLSLAYSPLSQLPFPVPGVAFQWWPNDWLRMNIGLPFQVILTPTPDWTFTASYMLLTTIHTQLSYRVAPCVRVYGGFDWTNEGFQLANRVNDRDRFLYYEKRLNVGAKLNWGQFRFDVSGGWAFDRYFTEGQGAFGGHDHLPIGNGPYFGLNASYRW